MWRLGAEPIWPSRSVQSSRQLLNPTLQQIFRLKTIFVSRLSPQNLAMSTSQYAHYPIFSLRPESGFSEEWRLPEILACCAGMALTALALNDAAIRERKPRNLPKVVCPLPPAPIRHALPNARASRLKCWTSLKLPESVPRQRWVYTAPPSVGTRLPSRRSAHENREGHRREPDPATFERRPHFGRGRAGGAGAPPPRPLRLRSRSISASAAAGGSRAAPAPGPGAGRTEKEAA